MANARKIFYPVVSRDHLMNNHLCCLFVVPSVPSKPKSHPPPSFLDRKAGIDIKMDGMKRFFRFAGGLSQHHAPVVFTHDS